MHTVVPCALLHAEPQAPQFVVVLSDASHPSASMLLQLPHPALQAAIAQAPVAHVAVAWARTHAVAHAPQLDRELSWVSQPFWPLASQSPHPVRHEGTHTPLVQAVPPCKLVQAAAHAPQWVTVLSWVSHPF